MGVSTIRQSLQKAEVLHQESIRISCVSYHSAWTALTYLSTTQAYSGYPWEQFAPTQTTLKRSSDLEVKYILVIVQL